MIGLLLLLAIQTDSSIAPGPGISHAQNPLKAELIFSLHQDPVEGATGMIPQITQVIDPGTGDPTTTLLGSFQAVLTYDGGCINILDVRELDFTVTHLVIDNTSGVTTFNGTSALGAATPSDLAHVLTRLVGSNQ